MAMTKKNLPSTAMLNEFKKFILKGNVVDLSTGVIIGASFTSIVTAFTKGIVEPILGGVGGGGTPDLKIPIGSRTTEVEEIVNGVATMVERTVPWIQLDIGLVIGAVIGFLITAAVVFFVIIKPVNAMMSLTKKREEAAPPPPPPAPPADVVLLTEIRDLLKQAGPRVP